ncbi:MAG: hypothetical protein ACTSXQ_06990 [Alphaproteobacteria bacterium]
MSYDLNFIYMIVGFLAASYSVIANDSIQTLGTFISSQKNIKWYYLWFVTSAVLILVLTYGWHVNGGDLSYGRLTNIPQPTNFSIWHVLAPLSLVFLTRFGVPVSTTFLVLSVFANEVMLEKMLMKSVMGYIVAAIAAYLIWFVIARLVDEHEGIDDPKKVRRWRVTQWFATGFLWASWLSHDMANIVVYLPRQLDVYWLIFVLAVMVTGLGIVFFSHGGKIQNIVLDKSGTRYVRSATLIDIFYALVLLFFKEYNNIPMSTSWVFVGLLCGRELAVYRNHDPEKKLKAIFPIITRDFFKLFIGLSVSVGFALALSKVG